MLGGVAVNFLLPIYVAGSSKRNMPTRQAKVLASMKLKEVNDCEGGRSRRTRRRRIEEEEEGGTSGEGESASLHVMAGVGDPRWETNKTGCRFI